MRLWEEEQTLIPKTDDFPERPVTTLVDENKMTELGSL